MIIKLQVAALDVLAAPNPGTGIAPPGSGNIETLLGWGAWLAFVACVGGLIVTGGKMALAQRGHGGGGEHAMGVVMAVIGAIVTGSAGLIITGIGG